MSCRTPVNAPFLRSIDSVRNERLYKICSRNGRYTSRMRPHPSGRQRLFTATSGLRSPGNIRRPASISTSSVTLLCQHSVSNSLREQLWTKNGVGYESKQHRAIDVPINQPETAVYAMHCFLPQCSNIHESPSSITNFRTSHCRRCQ
jgi:hypothetical protein